MLPKRSLSVIDGSLGVKMSSIEGSISKTVTKRSTSDMTTAMGNQTAKISIQEIVDVSSQENDNDEKENVPPLNSQEPLQTTKSKRSTKTHVRGRKHKNSNAIPVEDQDKRTMRAGSATSRARRSRGAVLAQGEQDGMDTIAGRLIAMRRREAPEDRLARELTVRPLADLSEAYGVAELPIVSDATSTATDVATRQEEGTQQLKSRPDANEAAEEPSSHAIITADLQAALGLLADTTNEHRSLPKALRPRRGIKRALELPVTSGPSRANVDNKTRALEGVDEISSSSRPTKRMRKGSLGRETPKVPSAELNEEDAGVPRVPHNSPKHSRYIKISTEDVDLEVPVPMPAFDLPDSISEGALAVMSTSIHIPCTSPQGVFSIPSNQENEEREGKETNDQTVSSFDTTQSSSHPSSFSELGSLNIEETFYPPSSPRPEVEA